METQLQHCADPCVSVPAAAITERAQPTRAGSLRGWLELVRPPNLFTVPGDILVGAALAGVATQRVLPVLAAVLISVLLYSSGLILNDFMDRHTDTKQRPGRPIPSGRVNAANAYAVAVMLMGTAIILSIMTGLTQLWGMAAIISGLIVLYNGPARKIPAVGFTVMGLCRGCNVLLGASVVGSPLLLPVLAGAGMESLYIICVSLLAHGEADKTPPLWKWGLPAAVIAATGPIMYLSLPTARLTTMVPLVILVAWLSAALVASGPWPGRTARRIGVLIRGLVLLHLLLILFALGQNPAWFNQASTGILILMFVVAEGLARLFHGS